MQLRKLLTQQEERNKRFLLRRTITVLLVVVATLSLTPSIQGNHSSQIPTITMPTSYCYTQSDGSFVCVASATTTCGTFEGFTGCISQHGTTQTITGPSSGAQFNYWAIGLVVVIIFIVGLLVRRESDKKNKKFCMNCGRKIPSGSRFCNNCGNKQP